jgi:hypothetical protein
MPRRSFVHLGKQHNFDEIAPTHPRPRQENDKITSLTSIGNGMVSVAEKPTNVSWTHRAAAPPSRSDHRGAPPAAARKPVESLCLTIQQDGAALL